ncbi:hypothetical protein TNCV_688561 [Trichonephila clavipes]|nr:hypothetical protein TNCV_688561 [Trichonephila clavipes]
MNGTPVGKQEKWQFLVPVLLITGYQEREAVQDGLPSDDLGSGPSISKAIHSKGAPILYSCSLPLVRFLGPLRVAQGSHVRQHFSTSLRTLFQ